MWRRSGKSLKQLARELGVTENRVRRAFYAWCDKRGVDPTRFMERYGPNKHRYNLPRKFVEEFTRAVRSEKHIVLKAGPNGEPIRVTE